MIDRQVWRDRALWCVGTFAVVWGFTAALGSDPQPLLLALATLSGFVLGGVVVDIHMYVDEADWLPPHRSMGHQWGLDPRFSRLSQSFHDGTDPQAVAEHVHRSLVPVIDGLLLSRHGLDRHEDPAAAREVLGNDVSDYLAKPPRYRRGHFTQLSTLITRIESL